MSLRVLILAIAVSLSTSHSLGSDELGLKCTTVIGTKFNDVGYKEEKIPKLCHHSNTSEISNNFKGTIGERKIVGGCIYTYHVVNDMAERLRADGAETCSSIAETNKSIGDSIFFGKSAEKIRTTAHDNLSKFHQQLLQAKKKSTDRTKANFELAKKEIELLKANGHTAQASELQAYLSKAEARPSISSREETNKINEPLIKRTDLAITGRATEQIVAANEGLRFKSLVEEKEKDVLAAMQKLRPPTPDGPGKDKANLTSVTENSFLGSAISGVLPLAPIAVPIVTSMMNKSKSGVGSTSPNNPFPMPKGPEQVAGSRLSQGDTKVNTAEFKNDPSDKPEVGSASVPPNFLVDSSEENTTPLLSDVGKGVTETAPPVFQGNLGKGQDLGFGKSSNFSGGEESKTPIGAGGTSASEGIPMARTTASASGSQLSSLLKQFEDTGSPGTPGSTDSTLSSGLGDDLLNQMEALNLPTSGNQKGEDPQVHTTSLFSRVRATHIRFIKRGGVTSEAGGKVL